MFDMGWTELLVIGVVALIVVGPKDLPKMFRTLGQMTAKARSMAREFSRAMEDAADASGVKDVARDLRGVADPKGMGLDEFNKMKNWDPLKDSPKQKPRADAKDAAPAPNADEDEDEMDRISAEMERLRTESKAKRAQADAPAADVAPQDGAAPDKPAQDTDSRA
jgi:sec-independent protein translocase protein TatB